MCRDQNLISETYVRTDGRTYERMKIEKPVLGRSLLGLAKIMQNWREEKGTGTLLFASVLHNFLLLLKIYRIVIFLEKLIGQWIPDHDGRGIARDITKNYFHFQNATKNDNKVGTIYKVGTFPLYKLSKLCYHFCQVLKMEIFFFLYL